MDNYFKESVPEAELGRPKIFNKERSAGIDLKVPRMSVPEILIWVRKRTYVQKLRQNATVITFILTETSRHETSQRTRCQIDCQGETLSMSNRQVRKNLVYRYMLKKSSKPGAVRLMRKYSLVDKGPLENETPQEKYAGEDVGSVQKECPNKIEGLAPCQSLGKLSSRREKDVKYW